MGRLELRSVGKVFGTTRALDRVDLEIGPGEIVGLTGPSGAGKSTVCRIVAGVEAPSTGDILIDGEPTSGTPPERRRVAFMFESYALYPHLTVADNVAFPLRAPGAPPLTPPEIAARVREILRLVELDGLDDRRPAELSGGQKQRVALCRALVQEPRVWVLDEPIAHLDAKLRHVLRGAIRRRLIATAVPTMWVSPDALETLAVADRVAVLVAGRLHQVGAPAEIYRRPASVEVARLVGDPPMNLVEGSLETVAGALRFRHPAFDLTLPTPLRGRLESDGRRDAVVLGLRPAEIQLGDGERSSVTGQVWVWEPFGRYGVLSVRLGPTIVKVKVPKRGHFETGAPVTLALDGADAVLFDASTGAAL